MNTAFARDARGKGRHLGSDAKRLRSRYDVTGADARPWLYGIATNLGRNH